MEAIFAALITGLLSLAGVVITCIATSHKNENNLKTSQAVTDTKIEALTREVRQHNNFAVRIPEIIQQLKDMEKRLEKVERKQDQQEDI